MSELSERLISLDRICADRGAPIELFRPGLDRSFIIQQLQSVVSEPPDDVIDWFAWHDGATSTRLTLGPSSFTGLSLSEAIDHNIRLHGQADDLGRVLERQAEQIWPTTRFPLAWNISGGLLAVELAGETRSSGAVYAIAVDTPESYEEPVMASPLDMVDFWLHILTITDATYDAANQEWTCSDRSVIPRSAFDTLLVDL